MFRYPKATHFDLLKVVEPYLANYYGKLLAINESPLQRFRRGFIRLYGGEEADFKQLTSESTQALSTQSSTIQTIETQQGQAVVLSEVLAKKSLHLKELFGELDTVHKQQVQWRGVRQRLQSVLTKQDTSNRFDLLLAQFQSFCPEWQMKILNHLDFKLLSEEDQETKLVYQDKILNVLILSEHVYQQLCFRHCWSLTDAKLTQILAASQSLQALSLVGCEQLTEEALGIIGRCVLGLKRLVLQDLSWITLDTRIKISSMFTFFSIIEGEADRTLFAALEILVVRDCSKLKTIHIALENLKQLVITPSDDLYPMKVDCPNLIYSLPKSLVGKASYMPMHERMGSYKVVLTALYVQHLKVINTALSISLVTDYCPIRVDFFTIDVKDQLLNTYKIQFWALPDRGRCARMACMHFGSTEALIGVFDMCASGMNYDLDIVIDRLNRYIEFYKNKKTTFIAISSALIPTRLTRYSIDHIRDTIANNPCRSYLHIIDPEDMEFESQWLKRWLVAIFLQESQPEWLIELQNQLAQRGKILFPNGWTIAENFMYKEYDVLTAINLLKPLNYFQLERFFDCIIQQAPADPLAWRETAYQTNAKVIIYLALNKHNLSVAHRAYTLLTQQQLIAYNSIREIDEAMWRVMVEMEAFVLQHQLNETHCNFSQHYFNDKDLAKISKPLADNKILAELNLEYNVFGLKGIQALCQALRSNRTITSLNLSNNKIDSKGVEALAEAWANSPGNLKTLNLSKNWLTSNAGLSLAKILQHNPIETLWLNENALLTDRGFEPIAYQLKSCSTLRKLECQSIGITSASCKLLALSIASISIKEINLSGNHFSSQQQSCALALSTICAAVAKANLSHCHLSLIQFQMLVNTMQSPNDRLKTLCISFNDFNVKLFDSLTQLIKKCPKLKTISAMGFKIEENYNNSIFLSALKHSALSKLEVGVSFVEPSTQFQKQANLILKANQ